MMRIPCLVICSSSPVPIRMVFATSILLAWMEKQSISFPP